MILKAMFSKESVRKSPAARAVRGCNVTSCKPTISNAVKDILELITKLCGKRDCPTTAFAMIGPRKSERVMLVMAPVW